MKIQLNDYLYASRWVLGFSGGVDSSVLLYILNNYPNHPPILAIYINHHLQKDNYLWGCFCKNTCQKLNVGFKSFDVFLEKTSENDAREARYSIFQNEITDKDVLFLAHHMNDNVETFLFRIFRGSGNVGLTSIKNISKFNHMLIVRPLLSINKEQILNYATQKQIQFVQDVTNFEDKFDRNFIRNRILPNIFERWRINNISKTINILNENQILLDDLAQIDLKNNTNNFLNTGLLKSLSEIRAKNALRYFLEKLKEKALNEQQFIEFLRFLNSKDCAKSKFQLKNGCFMQHDNIIFYIKNNFFDFNNEVLIFVTNGLNKLPLNGSVFLDKCPSGCYIKYRQNGEKFGTSSLKKILNKNKIPYFLRRRVPLLWHNNKLIAVANINLNKDITFLWTLPNYD